MRFRTLAATLTLLTLAAPSPAQDPLLRAIAFRNLSEMRRLIDAEPDRLESFTIYTPLQGAVLSDFREGVKLLLARGARLDLFSAAGLGKVERVKELLEADPLLVRARAADRWTALHWACWSGQAAIVRVLLAHKAEVERRNKEGRTPLHLAARQGFPAVVRLLLARGAPVDARGADGRTPLHEAFLCDEEKGQRWEVVRLLLRGKSDPRARDSRGSTPLHLAAAAPSGEAAARLLKLGVDVNAIDREGATPLHLAAGECGVEIIHLLLAAGARVNARDRKGRTPLNCVPPDWSESSRVADLLRRAGGKED